MPPDPLRRSWLLLLLLLAATIAATLVAAALLGPEKQSQTELAGYALGHALALYCGFRWLKVPSFRLTRFSPAIVPALVLLNPATALLGDALPRILPNIEVYHGSVDEMLAPNVWAFLSVVVAAPLFEELIFRGLVFQALLRAMPWRRVLAWQALIFAVGHLSPWAMLLALVWGLVLGLLFYYTQSILPGMAVHAGANALAFVSSLDTKAGPGGIRWVLGNDWLYALVLAGAAVVLFFSLQWVARRSYRADGPALVLQSRNGFDEA